MRKKFCLDNVLSFIWSLATFRLRNHYLCSLAWLAPWKCNIELAMTKNRFMKHNTNISNCLALRFINCQGESQIDRKLLSNFLERQSRSLVWVRYERNVRNSHRIINSVTWYDSWLAWITFGPKFSTINLVPLQSPILQFRFLSIIIGTPRFSWRIWGGDPEMFNPLI